MLCCRFRVTWCEVGRNRMAVYCRNNNNVIEFLVFNPTFSKPKGRSYEKKPWHIPSYLGSSWYALFLLDSHKTVYTSSASYTYHIISYHIISYHIIYNIISYHIISYQNISYHIVSYHIISYHIISYITSYHVISYIISYLFSFR